MPERRSNTLNSVLLMPDGHCGICAEREALRKHYCLPAPIDGRASVVIVRLKLDGISRGDAAWLPRGFSRTFGLTVTSFIVGQRLQ